MGIRIVYKKDGCYWQNNFTPWTLFLGVESGVLYWGQSESSAISPAKWLPVPEELIITPRADLIADFIAAAPEKLLATP